MDAQQFRRFKLRLKVYLGEFDDCFARKDTRAHLPAYVKGQLSELERKSIEPMALNAGVKPRTLQEFLSRHEWDEDRMRDRLQHKIAQEHASPRSIGIIDETSFVKKGDKTPGVQRQHCGAVGKQENCIVTVHLGYAVDQFHCLLDGELFLPEGWSDDRERCREAGIPDDMEYRPKTDIALELYERARGNGVSFAWLTFDEWYGVKPQFLRALDQREQKFVGEVHKRFVGWIEPPPVTTRRYGRRRVPRLLANARPAQYVEDMLRHPVLRDQAWQRYRVKDGAKGPQLWEAKHALIRVKNEEGLPADKPYHLVVARNVLNPDEVKYFVSNAPAETRVQTLLLVAFSRWRIERCFEDQKGEVGLDHYEGRRYPGLKRHLIITAVSFLFLARVLEDLRGEKPGANGLPGAQNRRRRGSVPVAQRESHNGTLRTNSQGTGLGPAKKRPSQEEPLQDDQTKATTTWHLANPGSPVHLGCDLAL